MVNDIWTKFMNVSSLEGVRLFQEEYKTTGDISVLNNLILALMDIGDWVQAKSICEKVINESEYCHESDFIRIGMIDWFTGKVSSAIDCWEKSIDAEYTDRAGAINGPLILWYAGKELCDDNLVKESLNKLKRFWKVKDYRIINDWVGSIAIAGFLLGKVPDNIFLNKWSCDIDALESRRLCRAHFWVGMMLLDKSKDEASKYFRLSFSRNKIGILEYEYFLAKWEYSRLKGEKLWYS